MTDFDWNAPILALRQSLCRTGSDVDAWRLLEAAKAAAKGVFVPGYRGPGGADRLRDDIDTYLGGEVRAP